MWFPSTMAVADFTVMITRFDLPGRARPLVRAVAETMDRLGFDHLLVDLNRDGESAWGRVYRRDPIVIDGSGRPFGAFEDQVTTAVREWLPEAEVAVEWREHDRARAAAAETCREIERVSRIFGGLARGEIPQRVRLAILDTESYLAQYGAAHAADERERPAELVVNALCAALADVGPRVGLGWARDRSRLAATFGDLRAAVAEGVDPILGVRLADPIGLPDLTDQIVATESVDPLVMESADYLHGAMFDAIREALASGLASEVAAEDSAGNSTDAAGAIPPSGWPGELVTSAPRRLSRYAPVLDPIEG